MTLRSNAIGLLGVATLGMVFFRIWSGRAALELELAVITNTRRGAGSNLPAEAEALP